MQSHSVIHIPAKIDRLNANRFAVAAHKYGFFLCRKGCARIMLAGKIYNIRQNDLCIYAPNVFIQILEKSDDIEGVLDEDRVETYYEVVSLIPIKHRLQIRNHPVVRVSEKQANEISLLSALATDTHDNGCPDMLSDMIHTQYITRLRQTLCLKVCEAYFANSPVDAQPQTREDIIFNNFLISLYANCHSNRTVGYYADMQHLSSYYFSSIVKEKSGRRASEWIEEVTMTFARRYLDDPQLSVKEIAQKMGFPDQSTFGRYFRLHEGCSPTAYRNRSKNTKSIDTI